MTRMLTEVTQTWNPVTGCLHGCRYCWGRRLALGRLRKHYPNGFVPRFRPKKLRARFKPGDFVFVCDMSDLFGDWVPGEWIKRVLEVIEKHPDSTFLMLTKNPARYHAFSFPEWVVLGATIESDVAWPRIGSAPDPLRRAESMISLRGRKSVTVEPILDFSLNRFAGILKMINPDVIWIGYENYGCRLPEPPLWKTLKLIERLRESGIEVREKTLRPAWWEAKYAKGSRQEICFGRKKGGGDSR